MSLINREKAIRTIMDYNEGAVTKFTAKELLEQLPEVKPEVMYYPQVDGVTPSVIAQPEIIRCEDCKHRHEAECPMYHEEDIEWDDDGYIERVTIYHDWTKDDGYCDRAERRNDD